MRSQIDYCFALKENVVSNRIRLWKYFFGGFEHFDDFQRVFNECTNNNECLVIDNTVKSNELSDMIFWYKADVAVSPYKLGDSKLWKTHRAYYRTPEELEKVRSDNLLALPTKNDRRITHIAKLNKNSEEDEAPQYNEQHLNGSE